MIYFLDFDRTLFDTDSFKAYLAERDHDSSITGEPELDVSHMLNERASSGTLSFAPGELARFVYPDVAEFLRQRGNDVTIITFGNPALQKAKVESALADVVRGTTLYTNDRLKAEYLKDWSGYDGQPAVFVDDSLQELAAMSAAFPSIRVHEMRRDGAIGDGRWPVVHSLADLLTPEVY